MVTTARRKGKRDVVGVGVEFRQKEDTYAVGVEMDGTADHSAKGHR